VAEFDVVIIGAGLVGLACAEALAQRHAVLVVERHARVGEETSSRNSGVLHAGIYYPKGSLKARLCLRGRQLLEARGRDGRITLVRTGKLVVATSEGEIPDLERLAENAAECGVPLRVLSTGEVARLEPMLRVKSALWSQDSGIIDTAGLVTSYRRGAMDHGATLLLGTSVTAIERGRVNWNVALTAPDGSLTHVRTEWIVNAAGLSADQIANLAGVDVRAHGLVQKLCKGSYFSLSRRWSGAVSRLIYPLPHGGGLGIHLTLDLAGNLRAGPDARYVTEAEVTPDESALPFFAEALRRYLPDLRDEDLSPAYAGLRPKLAGPGEPSRDFAIRDESVIGLPGLINLLGIESPGLTASPAIAERVAGIVSSMGSAT
jgi:L-2-hydroxyglutarate oxidase LhgO